MDYPRPITSIHQIEISTFCNLRCTYCPSPKLDKPVSDGGFGRDKQDMTRDVFERTLEWATYFDARGTQGELALTGIGEALLHPEFPEFLRLAREALPDNLITFSTNGILLTDEMLDRIEPYQPAIFVSLHRPEKAAPAINRARKRNLLMDTNNQFATNAFDWAGGVEWEVSIAPRSVTCEFLKTGWSVVLADGRFAVCCLDATGASSMGTVWEEIGSLGVAPWSGKGPLGEVGCGPCHAVVPQPPNVRKTRPMQFVRAL